MTEYYTKTEELAQAIKAANDAAPKSDQKDSSNPDFADERLSYVSKDLYESYISAGYTEDYAKASTTQSLHQIFTEYTNTVTSSHPDYNLWGHGAGLDKGVKDLREKLSFDAKGFDNIAEYISEEGVPTAKLEKHMENYFKTAFHFKDAEASVIEAEKQAITEKQSELTSAYQQQGYSEARAKRKVTEHIISYTKQNYDSTKLSHSLDTETKTQTKNAEYRDNNLKKAGVDVDALKANSPATSLNSPAAESDSPAAENDGKKFSWGKAAVVAGATGVALFAGNNKQPEGQNPDEPEKKQNWFQRNFKTFARLLAAFVAVDLTVSMVKGKPSLTEQGLEKVGIGKFTSQILGERQNGQNQSILPNL